MLPGRHMDLSAGRAAWLSGDLDAAVTRLRAAFAKAPRSPDALYPLALALSERGDVAGALEALDQAASAAEKTGPPRLFRALVLYDHNRDADAAESLRGVDATNIIARGLSALMAFRSSPDPTRLVLAPGARWMAEIAGRLFAIVGGRLFQQDLKEAIRFHQDTLPPPPGNVNDSAEEAFAAGRHKDAARLFAGPGARTAEERAVRRGFSLLALDREADANRALDDAWRARPTMDDVHYVRGILHTRYSRPREAAWAFVRTARLSDYEFHGIVQAAANKIGVQIEDAEPG